MATSAGEQDAGTTLAERDAGAEQRRKGRRKRQRRPQQHAIMGNSRWMPYAFSAPAVLTIAVILAFPIVFAAYRSLFRLQVTDLDRPFIGLGNYQAVLADEAFWAAAQRSLVFVAGVIILGVGLSVFFGYALLGAVGKLRWIRGLTVLPYIVASVATAVMFRFFFDTDYGLPNQILALFGLPEQRWMVDPTLVMFVVIVAQVWGDLPLATLVILGGLQTLDSSYLDAALVDGATPFQRAIHISLPLISPQLILSAVWMSYKALVSLGVILALTGGGPGTATQTVPLQMYDKTFRELDTGQGLAIAILLFLANAILTLLYLRLQKRYQAA